MKDKIEARNINSVPQLSYPDYLSVAKIKGVISVQI